MEQKHFPIIFASIVFAALAWMSINMGDEYTVVKHMPVVLENLPEGRALKYPVPKTIDVWFRGRGWQLAALYFSPDVRYFIDLSSVAGENFTISRRDLFEHIKLPVALQPIDVKPDTLVLALDEYREKRARVLPRVVLGFHDGYGQVGQAKVIPESVTISGSRMLLSTIGAWPTAYRKFDDLRAPVDEQIPLEEPATYSVDLLARSVRFQVGVQAFAEKVFAGIPIVVTGRPANREVIFIPPKVDLIVRGGIDQLAKLAEADFQAAIDYRKLVQDSTGAVVPSISVPPEVKIVSRKPEQFQFIIRKRL